MQTSCIIPTRDRCDLVCRAIASVLAQETAGLEVVVVDDGSTDSTAAVVGDRFPQVRLVRLSGLGPGPARNAGVAAASGDMLMFLDSDDVWLPGHAAALTGVVERGFSVAYGTARNLDAVNGGEFLIPDLGEGVEGDCFEALLRWCFLVPSATAVTRETFEQSGGFLPGDLGEDWAFFLRLAERVPFGFAGSRPITIRHLHRHSLCFLAGRDRIIASLRLVVAALEQGGRAAPQELARFAAMEEWIMDKAEPWDTVQQWYVAMKHEGMV